MDAVIGLGSNLGDRRGTLTRAASEIRALGQLTATSSLYETTPVGPPQPMFLNAAVALSTSLDPPGLLAALLGIERKLGRVRRERWGARSIDLDILWIAEVVFDTADLTVPHPELRSRAFALRPLLDVAPLAADPRDGKSYRAILAELGPDLPLEIAAGPDGWA
ncbi:MAG TPA: 2-amino-4-hydroxy-6-hydroxymethyldihydropteridine diphosphokinase [Polyangiaceae bacterium]|nr:2-amino-4-hydroxy-6-hydroxymethyldihydropteridine diphosphokinase [Polyangiaceae bacterium]